MRTALDVKAASGNLRFVGSRDRARELRNQVRALLRVHQEVTLDFSGLSASQSFVDELVGILVIEETPDVLNRVVFKACNPGLQAALEFVVADRYDEFVRMHAH